MKAFKIISKIGEIGEIGESETESCVTQLTTTGLGVGVVVVCTHVVRGTTVVVYTWKWY